MRPNLHGALLLDKPQGVSSTGALNKLKGMLRAQGLRGKKLPKVGHGGTLDPFATGLLVVLVGHATTLASYRLKDHKVYGGTIVFGEKTPSGDPETEVCETGPIPPFESIGPVARSMVGPYLQVPPMHSAKKVQGKRLYELARKGREIEREAVACELHDFTVLQGEEPNLVKFEVSCSSGTFIRTLAEDLARKLGTVAHLRTLDRLGSGFIKKCQSLTLDELQVMTDRGEDWTASSSFISLEELLKDWPFLMVEQEHEERLLEGRLDLLQSLLSKRKEERMVLKGASRIIGFAHRKMGEWAFLRMFP